MSNVSMGRVTKKKKKVKKSVRQAAKAKKAAMPMAALDLEVTPVVNKKELHIVPWSSSEEWEHVCGLVNEENWKEADKTFKIWEQRVSALPLVAEASQLIVQAKVYDLKPMGPGRSDAQARSLYGIALLRFLNYTGHFAATAFGESTTMPTKELTASVGIPDWMVTLRNELTHGAKVSSLEALRLAGDCIIDWLKKFYWKPTRDADAAEESGTDLGEETTARTLLDYIAAFVTVRIHKQANTRIIHCRRLGIHLINKPHKIKTDAALKEMKAKIFSWARNNWELTRDVLADAMMVPPMEFYMQFQDVVGVIKVDSFQQLCWIWNPIIKTLMATNALSELLLRFGQIHAAENSSADKYRQELSGKWIKRFLGLLEDSGKQYSKKYWSLLEIVMQNPNSSTNVFIPKLFQVLGSQLSPEVKENLLALASIWSDESGPRSMAANDQGMEDLFSVDDVYATTSYDGSTETTTEGDQGEFVLDTQSSDYWSSVPFGGFTASQD